MAGVAVMLYTFFTSGIGKRLVRASLLFVPGALMFLYAKLHGWITPSLFYQSGVQPLQLCVPMYADDDQYGDGLQEHKYTLDAVEKSYDYLWTSNTD